MSSPSGTVRLTVAQAVVRFLANQWTRARRRAAAAVRRLLRHLRSRQRRRHRPGAAAGGAAGHGRRRGPGLPYVLARNEQAMVHTAVGLRRQKDRLQTWACTASVGPGSTNMLTGAALATINRLPVLLLPSGTFADPGRRPGAPGARAAVRRRRHRQRRVPPAVASSSTEVDRPEQLPSALLGAMRVLTDPVETGAVDDLAAAGRPGRGVRLAGGALRRARLARRAAAGRAGADRRRRRTSSASARRPLVVAGGGVHYSGAEDALRAFCEATGIPVGETQAGKGSLPARPPAARWARSARPAPPPPTPSPARPTSSSASAPGGPTSPPPPAPPSSDAGVRFVNINVAAFDAGKHSGLSVVADAREALDRAHRRPRGLRRDPAYRTRIRPRCGVSGTRTVEAAYDPPSDR